MKICKHCGRENPDTLTKCKHCGNLLKDGKKHHKIKKLVKVKKTKKPKSLLLIIDLAILFIFLAFFGINKFVLHNSTNPFFGSYSIMAAEDKKSFMKKYDNFFKDIYDEKDSDIEKVKKLNKKLYEFDIENGDIFEFSLIKNKITKLKKKIEFENYENLYELPLEGERENNLYFLQKIWQKRFKKVKQDFDFLLALDDKEDIKNRIIKYGKCPRCNGSGIDPEETNIYAMPVPGTKDYESVGHTPDSCCLCYGSGYNIPHEFYEELFDYETEFNKLLYIIEGEPKGLKFMHDPTKKKPIQRW